MKVGIYLKFRQIQILVLDIKYRGSTYSNLRKKTIT